MKSLIIGGAGFVGKYLAEELQNAGDQVAVTKLPFESADIPGAAVFDLDILDGEALRSLLEAERPEHIYHLAAVSSVALSWKNPALTIDVNVKGAANLLEAVRNLPDQPRVLLVGSGEEYGRVGEGECPISESAALRPGNIYAATKACQNMLGSIYASAYGLDVMMARAFNHIGPGQAPLFVAADFCRQVAEIEAGTREPIISVGNLSAKRDFSDVRDVVRAYRLILEKGRAGETYNVGSGRAVSIEGLLNGILALAKRPVAVKTDESRFRPADVPLIEADVAKLYRETGWKPQIPLEQTLEETLDFWRGKTGAR